MAVVAALAAAVIRARTADRMRCQPLVAWVAQAWFFFLTATVAEEERVICRLSPVATLTSGAPGHGGGGAGRIRINTAPGGLSASGVLSPNASLGTLARLLS